MREENKGLEPNEVIANLKEFIGLPDEVKAEMLREYKQHRIEQGDSEEEAENEIKELEESLAYYSAKCMDDEDEDYLNNLLLGIPQIIIDADSNYDLILQQYISNLARDMCRAVMVDSSRPLVIRLVHSDEEVCTPSGYKVIGNSGYEYAELRRKDTKEEFIMISLNCDNEHKDNIKRNLALAIGDIVSFQIESHFVDNDVAKGAKTASCFRLMRSAAAVAIAYNAITSVTDFDNETHICELSEFITLFAGIEYLRFDEFIDIDIDFESKIDGLLELFALYYSAGLNIQERWKSSHILYKTVVNIQNKAFEIFRKLRIASPYLEKLYENFEDDIIKFSDKIKDKDVTEEDYKELIDKLPVITNSDGKQTLLIESISQADIIEMNELIDGLAKLI